MSIVVVYAPEGAGKSKNATALALHFRSARVVDDWSVAAGGLREGDLALTNDPQAMSVEVSRRYRLLTLQQALAEMGGATNG